MPPSLFPNYHTVYTHVYAHVHRPALVAYDPKVLFDEWVTRFLARKHLRLSERMAWWRHLTTLLQTQRLGRLAAPATRRRLQAAARLWHFAALGLVVALQRCVLERLWRPGGTLMLRHRPWEMLTPMPDGSCGHEEQAGPPPEGRARRA